MFNKIKLMFWLSIPFFLMLLPATFFDKGQSICPSKLLLDKECFGCGITRSVQHAVHFDWSVSWEYNKLVIVVLPVLIYIWIKTLIDLIKKIKNNV